MAPNCLLTPTHEAAGQTILSNQTIKLLLQKTKCVSQKLHEKNHHTTAPTVPTYNQTSPQLSWPRLQNHGNKGRYTPNQYSKVFINQENKRNNINNQSAVKKTNNPNAMQNQTKPNQTNQSCCREGGRNLCHWALKCRSHTQPQSPGEVNTPWRPCPQQEGGERSGRVVTPPPHKMGVPTGSLSQPHNHYITGALESASATTFSWPLMCRMSKLYACRNSDHLINLWLGHRKLFIKLRGLWSV